MTSSGASSETSSASAGGEAEEAPAAPAAEEAPAAPAAEEAPAAPAAEDATLQESTAVETDNKAEEIHELRRELEDLKHEYELEDLRKELDDLKREHVTETQPCPPCGAPTINIVNSPCGGGRTCPCTCPTSE